MQDGITQRRRGPVKVCIQDAYLAGILPEVYVYMAVRHPHICTDISVDAELVRDGPLDIRYPEREETGEQIITSMTSHNRR